MRASQVSRRSGNPEDGARVLVPRRAVLLLEDEPAQRRTLSEILADEGLEVQACAGLDSALRRVAERRFAVAIADQRLRSGSGLDFLRRARERDPGLRVIVHTAYGSFDSAREALNLGAFAYVEKAGDPGELLRQVRRALHACLEDELRTSRAWLEGFFEHVPAVVTLKDRSGRYLYVNRHFEELFGVAREEVIGRLPHERKSGVEHAERSERHDREVLLGGQSIEREYELRVAGEAHTFLVLKFPVRDAAGRGIGVGSIATDITARKRVEQALARSEAHLRALYEDAPDIHLGIAADGTIRSINRFGARYLGYDKEDLLGRALLDLVEREDRAALGERLAALAGSEGDDGALEFRLLRSGGESLWVHARVIAGGLGAEPAEIRLVCRDVSATRALAEELSYRASHDPLTGLVNRGELEARLERVLETARRDGSEHALCYLDLDQFKVVNDTCGHLAGDELLRQLGELLPTCVRKRDTLARVGGDEFAVLLERCSLVQARRVANAIRATLRQYRFAWEGRRFRVGASIGVVRVDGASESVGEVLGAADSACYTAKEQGRDRVHVYRPDEAGTPRRQGDLDWVLRIEQALEGGALFLCAQPIRALPLAARGRPRWIELLLRMRGEDGEVVRPGTFLPVAERFRLLGRIDRWVVAAAVRWLAEEPQVADVELCSVNVSSASLADGQFLRDVIEILDRSELAAERLCFEITETAAASNMSSTARFIRALRAWGCQFALDDFGAGVSSLGYLKQLPVDYVKIDGSFVRNLTGDPIDRAMVRAIQDVARVLGKRTVAEHTASAEVIEELAAIGVDFVQGYAVGRPREIDSGEPVEGEGGEPARRDPRAGGEDG